MPSLHDIDILDDHCFDDDYEGFAANDFIYKVLVAVQSLLHENRLLIGQIWIDNLQVEDDTFDIMELLAEASEASGGFSYPKKSCRGFKEDDLRWLTVSLPSEDTIENIYRSTDWANLHEGPGIMLFDPSVHNGYLAHTHSVAKDWTKRHPHPWLALTGNVDSDAYDCSGTEELLEQFYDLVGAKDR